MAKNKNALRISSSESKPVQDERDFVVSLIKHPNEPVLDVGTGGCACVASHLLYRGYQVVASDHDRVVIRAARGFLARRRTRKRVTLIRDDITHSKLRPESFLNIVSFNVLHHVADFTRAVAELHRILAPQGRLIISDYDENETGFLRMLRREVRRQFADVTAYSRPPKRLVLVCEKSAACQGCLPKG